MTLILYAVLHSGAHFLLENPVQSLAMILAIRHCKPIHDIYRRKDRAPFLSFYRFGGRDIKGTKTYSCCVFGMRLFTGSAEIFHHPRLRALLDHLTVFHCNTYLGMFGAKTWKPVHLVSTDQVVERLLRTVVTSSIMVGNERLAWVPFHWFLVDALTPMKFVCFGFG